MKKLFAFFFVCLFIAFPCLVAAEPTAIQRELLEKTMVTFIYLQKLKANIQVVEAENQIRLSRAYGNVNITEAELRGLCSTLSSIYPEVYPSYCEK